MIHCLGRGRHFGGAATLSSIDCLHVRALSCLGCWLFDGGHDTRLGIYEHYLLAEESFVEILTFMALQHGVRYTKVTTETSTVISKMHPKSMKPS